MSLSKLQWLQNVDLIIRICFVLQKGYLTPSHTKNSRRKYINDETLYLLPSVIMTVLLAIIFDNIMYIKLPLLNPDDKFRDFIFKLGSDWEQLNLPIHSDGGF